MDPLTMVLLFVVMIGAMYVLMIRPANKRMREQQDAQSKLAPGDRVVLPSGIFATIRYIGDKTMVVELAPDVLITILKSAVGRVAAPDEEEFEFEDGNTNTVHPERDAVDPPAAAQPPEAAEGAPADAFTPLGSTGSGALTPGTQPGAGASSTDPRDETRPGMIEER